MRSIPQAPPRVEVIRWQNCCTLHSEPWLILLEAVETIDGGIEARPHIQDNSVKAVSIQGRLRPRLYGRAPEMSEICIVTFHSNLACKDADNGFLGLTIGPCL